jgi:hypothetical protein
MVMGRIFSVRNNRNFFEPDPNPAQPEKCSGLGLNMGLLLQALKKTENLSQSTSVAHSKRVLPYY